MTLTGSLPEFTLGDIFGLLAGTRKSGALHLRRSGERGDVRAVVHLDAGRLTGASADLSRQALGRRLVGAGLVDDATLAQAIRRAARGPGVGLARALADSEHLDREVVLAAVAEHVVDALFDLLRWTDGDFAFQVGEANPDEVGFAVPVHDALKEASRRLDQWTDLARAVPSQSSVVALTLNPPGELAVSAEEWALAALIDGRRTVDDLVALSGRGSFAVVTALASLSARGLVTVAPEGQAGTVADLQRRQSALLALERPTPTAPVPLPSRPVDPEPVAEVQAPEPVVAEPVAEVQAPEPVVPEPAVTEPPPAPVVTIIETPPAHLSAAPARPDEEAEVAVPSVAPAAVPAPLAAVPDPVDAREAVAAPAPEIDSMLLARLIDGVRAL